MGGFVVYIDESGDEGFKFGADGTGSSKWFVLSAAVVRAETEMEVVTLVDRVRATLKMKPRAPLHFRKLNHSQRLPLMDEIGKARLRTVSILIHKPSIKDPTVFRDTHSFYRYASRFLLERVSWLCRDHKNAATDTARLVFSNRSSMSYEDLRGYLRHMRANSTSLDCRIEWDVIDPDNVIAIPHEQRMGLQIADAVASSMFCGVEPHYGLTEPRYAQMLKPTIYAHRGKRLNYGLKTWPKEADGLLGSRELAWIGELGT